MKEFTVTFTVTADPDHDVTTGYIGASVDMALQSDDNGLPYWCAWSDITVTERA